MTIADFVREAIYSKVDQGKVPNAETIKALEESRQGVGVNKYSSVREMFEEIEREMAEEDKDHD